MADFTNIKHFKPAEFHFPEKMDQDLINKLDTLREQLGEPIKINSDFREPDHNAEVGGVQGSQHLTGHAVDIALGPDGAYLYRILKLAFGIGFTGIGIKRVTGQGGLLHLDNRPLDNEVWTY